MLELKEVSWDFLPLETSSKKVAKAALMETCGLFSESSSSQKSCRVEPRSLEECISILSDPQVINHIRWKSNFHFACL